MKYKNIYYLVVLFVIQMFVNKSVQSMIPQEVEEKYGKIAISKLVVSPKSYAELEKTFDGVLLEKPKAHFNKYFSLIFDPNFPKQKHTDKKVLEGWRCLYGKMTYARTLEDKEAEVFQFAGINGLLSFHKDALVKFDKAANEEIPEQKTYACPRCKEKDVFGTISTDKCFADVDGTDKVSFY